MGSGAETARETVAALNARGERVGVVQVRLYRPFPAQALLDALPADACAGRRARPHEGARLDRRAAVPRRRRRADRGPPTASGRMPRVVGGRYGLSSKEFTPGMVAGVFAELAPRAAAAPVHDRHPRRRLRHQPPLRRGARHRAAGDGPRGLLRPRLRRDRRREQEHDQDPRRRGGPARAGLLRLRLEEVRLADGLAPALRAAADPRALPRAAGRASSAATSSACSTGSTCSAAPPTARRCC